MKKILYVFFALSLLFLSCSKNSEVKIGKIAIVYSGNIGGKSTPCGCKPPMGGFARRSTVINSIRGEYDNVLVVDSGALLYSSNFLIAPYDYIHRLNAAMSARAVDMTGIDAVNVSSYDLANSVDSLLTIEKATSYPWLSSNLAFKKSGELVFQPGTVISKGDIRIGIFGIMSDNFMGAPIFKDDSSLRVLDFIETAENEVSKLKKESDLIVALAYLSKNEMKKLSESVPDIDIIIHSHNGYHSATSEHDAFTPIKNDKTLILRCPDGGRVIGCVELKIVNNSTDFTEVSLPVDYIQEKKDEKTDTADNKESTFMNYFIDLGPEIVSDSVIKEKIDIVERIKQAYRNNVELE